MKVADIDRFFADLGRRINQPVQILLTGGAAAILQGVSRATFDIDFEVRLKTTEAWNDVEKAIEETSAATGIAAQYGEDIDRWSSIALPNKSSRLYRRFGKLEVRILHPGVWAIGKLARYLSSDIHDMRVVLSADKIRPTPLVKLWGTALGISRISSSHGSFRRQVENFLDQYAREIWGPQTDTARLKRLFLETAQKTRTRK